MGHGADIYVLDHLRSLSLSELYNLNNTHVIQLLQHPLTSHLTTRLFPTDILHCPFGKLLSMFTTTALNHIFTEMDVLYYYADMFVKTRPTLLLSVVSTLTLTVMVQTIPKIDPQGIVFILKNDQDNVRAHIVFALNYNSQRDHTSSTPRHMSIEHLHAATASDESLLLETVFQFALWVFQHYSFGPLLSVDYHGRASRVVKQHFPVHYTMVQDAYSQYKNSMRWRIVKQAFVLVKRSLTPNIQDVWVKQLRRLTGLRMQHKKQERRQVDLVLAPPHKEPWVYIEQLFNQILQILQYKAAAKLVSKDTLEHWQEFVVLLTQQDQIEFFTQWLLTFFARDSTLRTFKQQKTERRAFYFFMPSLTLKI